GVAHPDAPRRGIRPRGRVREPAVSPSLRARLTAWYTAVLALVLAACAGGLYLVHSRARLRDVDQELARAAALSARHVVAERDAGGALDGAAREPLEDILVPGLALAVFDGGGSRLAGEWEGLPPPPADGERGATTVATPAGRFRVWWARHRHAEAS